MITPTTIIQPLGRWRPRRRKPVHAARWQQWAAGLRQHHGREPIARFGPAMTLARMLRTTSIRSYSTVYHAWALQPQIHLAIQPALAPSVPAFVVARPGAELGPLSPGSRGRTSDEGMNAIVANRGGDRSSSERAGLRSIGAAGPSPEAMQRVFLRAGPAGGSAGVLATRLEREAVLVEQGLQVVRRIVDDRRRVEEQRWTPHVARRVGTAIPTMDAEREAGGVMTHARRTHLRPSGDDSQAPPRSVPSAPVAPAMDVQQLTDQVMQQIDRRLVAYRERLGKAF